jgi:translation initiation factor IF-2
MSEENKTIELGEAVTVSDFANKINRQPGEVITKLIENGIMATLNEVIDYDTAEIIASEFDVEVTPKKSQKEVRAERAQSESADVRPPIVAVMGHVDHGKTSLLDAIRNTDTADAEAGGITQHISAYQIKHKDRLITFLDTPGHEAFAALRQHGAQLTDVALLVVAADDGVKPQTIEAINFAKRAGVPMIVAINKTDKPDIDLNRVKKELTDNGIVPEEYGGDTVLVEVSAKTEKNINELLDLVFLQTDIQELRGDTEGPAEGIVIEARMIHGKGPVATVLVEHGKLEVGNIIVAGAANAKVRKIESTSGNELKVATASTPASIIGFKDLPRFGDVFQVVASEKEARKIARTNRQEQLIAVTSKSKSLTAENRFDSMLAAKDMSELPIIIKADVQGSLGSLAQAIREIGNDEVEAQIIETGVGDLTESDVNRAASSNALIYGFNIKVPVEIKKLAARNKVTIKIYTVIYELLDDIKAILTKMLPPETIETDVGRLQVKGVFRTTKNAIICGGEVTKGKVLPKTFARIERGKTVLGEVEIEKVQREQSEVKEVVEGQMCGLSLATKTKIMLEVDDRLNVFTREERARTL